MTAPRRDPAVPPRCGHPGHLAERWFASMAVTDDAEGGEGTLSEVADLHEVEGRAWERAEDVVPPRAYTVVAVIWALSDEARDDLDARVHQGEVRVEVAPVERLKGLAL